MRLFFYALTGIALGWWEGVVVVYIREILKSSAVNINNDVVSLLNIPLTITGNRYTLLFIERTREICPILIILLICLFFEKKAIRKIAAFFFIFAIWDIFYYLTLKILMNWPASFKTIDCLFLIPEPWIGPVWIPLSIMLVFLLISGYIFSKNKKIK